MTPNLTSALRNFLFAASFISVIFSCKTNDKRDDSSVKTVKASDLIASPVVHDTLSQVQIEKIKKIQIAFQEVNPSTLEETIINFKRDQHPDSEIAVWLTMADVYEKFTSIRTSLDIEKKKEAYELILIRSMMDETEAKNQASVKLLTASEVAEIFSYYKSDPKPISVGNK